MAALLLISDGTAGMGAGLISGEERSINKASWGGSGAVAVASRLAVGRGMPFSSNKLNTASLKSQLVFSSIFSDASFVNPSDDSRETNSFFSEELGGFFALPAPGFEAGGAAAGSGARLGFELAATASNWADFCGDGTAALVGRAPVDACFCISVAAASSSCSSTGSDASGNRHWTN